MQNDTTIPFTNPTFRDSYWFSLCSSGEERSPLIYSRKITHQLKDLLLPAV